MLTIAVLPACAPLPGLTEEGTQRAESVAERIAIGMADDVTRSRTIIGIDAEDLAYQMLDGYRVPSVAGEATGEYRVEALDWSGESSWAEPSEVLVRVGVSVPGSVGQGFSEPRQPAGDAIACYLITLPVSGGPIGATVDEVECPEGAIARVPRATASVSLPDDAEALIEGELARANESALAVETALRAALGPGVTVTSALVDGALVVAAHGTSTQDCIIIARTPDGLFSRVTLSPEQKLPGEVGCSTQAYTSPSPTGG